MPDIAVSFRDGVCGPQTERLAETCGDFIVRRSDGVYAYQLAVVCDDALGSVTEVVRGSDLLGSTARQLWLFSVFGYPAPQYYHVPLLVAPDGRRLSKRERDLDMEALRARCTPEQLVGRLAQLVGLQPGPEPVRAADLVSRFSWERIPRGEIEQLLKRSFRPEFLNRLDEIVFYKPLTKENIVKIIDLQMDALNARLADKQLHCELTPEAKQFIIDAF